MVEASFQKIKTKALFKVGGSIFDHDFLIFEALSFFPLILLNFSIKIFTQALLKIDLVNPCKDQDNIFINQDQPQLLT